MFNSEKGHYTCRKGYLESFGQKEAAGQAVDAAA